MEYFADGYKMTQGYKSLTEAFQASLNAPWANGGVYASNCGALYAPEEYIINITQPYIAE